MSTAFRIRAAEASEADVLTALAFESKRHWGYDDAFMSAVRAELSLSAGYVEEHPTFVAERGGSVVGFYALEPHRPREVELGYLFVRSTEIGAGVGRALFEHAAATARALGCSRIVVQGDPNAEGFYLAMGARRTGARESSSVPGRMLPLFAFDLE